MKKLIILALSAIFALASCTKDANLDGKWNAPRDDSRPNDIAVSLIFKGNKLDLYICSYGWHFVGTYTYADETIKYKITDAYVALSDVTLNEDGKTIKYASSGIDGIDHNTLKPNPGYEWYDLILYRDDLYEEYVEWLSSFSFEIGADGKATSDILGMGGTFTKVN